MKKMNKKSKQRMLIGITIIIVVILVLSGTYIYFEFIEEEKGKKEKEIEIREIDDQISPLTNQGLIVEINRIRHRGLYDDLMKPGTSWKKKPTFWYVLTIDGLEYSSKDVEHIGKVVETPFVGWDTMFQENKIMRDAEEEQEKSEITITFVERVKKGILSLRNQDIERDSISVTYDYRTGRWDGIDDRFMDKDGYGHYIGDTFEFWFNIYQVDNDLDYIPYWTEVNVLGTDPQRDDSKRDPDGDGVPTSWEWKWGYDPFVWEDHEKLDPDMDGIENIEEYQMEKWFADPYSQDIYIEVDWMGKGGIFDPPHILFEESQQAIIEKYAEHNIKVYFDCGWPDSPSTGGGQELPHYKQLSQDSGRILMFYNHYFPDERKGIFRYVVIGHAGPFNHPSKFNVYNSMHITYNLEFMTRLKDFLNPDRRIIPNARTLRIRVASTLMHELGHSVGIRPWTFEGCDNFSFLGGRNAKKQYDETWGNYYSVMNYYHMYKTKCLDYSHGKNGPPYDQNDWENLWVAIFQYNRELIEEIYFHPPGFDKIVWGETEVGVTGYEYNEELTDQFREIIGDFSPIDPVKVDWLVFILEDKEKYPEYKELKILAHPVVPLSGWCLYGEGELDSEGNIQFYSQQDLIDGIMSKIS